MILALDSSSSRGSVALVDGQIVREIGVDAPRGRGGALFGALEQILESKPNLERVVVGTGPGSYNGIRAALGAGWGIARAREIPLVGVCSLLGLDEGNYCAVGDARRGQFYFAAIREGALATEPTLLSPDEIQARVIGARVFVPAPVAFLPDAEVRMPSAVRLAGIGTSMPTSSHVPEPLYLKAPFITEPRTVR